MIGNLRTVDVLCVRNHDVAIDQLGEEVVLHARAHDVHPFQLLRATKVLRRDAADDGVRVFNPGADFRAADFDDLHVRRRTLDFADERV